MKNQKNRNGKFIYSYTVDGMTIGIGLGMFLGSILFEKIISGMAIGIPVGMCIGLIIGFVKEKKLEKKIMKVIKIEDTEKEGKIIVFVKDKHGVDKQYEVTKEKVDEKNFEVGDSVVEEKEGGLVFLKSK